MAPPMSAGRAWALAQQLTRRSAPVPVLRMVSLAIMEGYVIAHQDLERHDVLKEHHEYLGTQILLINSGDPKDLGAA